MCIRDRSGIKDNAQSAREEETKLRDAIRDAVENGDVETAQALRAQLKDLRKGNVSEKQSDKAELGAARKELKRDLSVRHEKAPKRR